MIRQPPPPNAGPIKAGLPERWRVMGICLALAVITFSVFGQTLTHDFVNFDDDVYVYENPVVSQGLTWKGILWAFSAHANNWHPLTWLSHMLDCQLYGLHPAGHHLTNVLLHIAVVLTLFLVLRRMTGATWRSAFVAAVFAVHPLRVESVAWVAERKDVLSGLFFVLTIGAYARYALRPGSGARYGCVLLLFALGLMSKPMLVTLPVVLLLLDYWPLQRQEGLGKLLFEKAPLFALSGLDVWATFLAQDKAVHLGATFSLAFRLGNAAVASMIYLGQMFWPAGLAVYYPYPFGGYPRWEMAVALLLPAAISWWTWRQRRTQPWLLIGWLWYLVMLLPVIGLIQVGGQAHADRYTYLPQIGLYLALTWLFSKWLAPRLAAILMTGLIAALMLCTVKQTTFWKDSETLWKRDLACTTDNEIAHDNLAGVYIQEGNAPAAIAELQEALKISPSFEPTHVSLARELLLQGNVAGALAEYRAALRIDPQDTTVKYTLAWVLSTAPQASWRNGAEAVQLARQANETAQGKDPVILGVLAAALAETGQFAGAAETAQKGIELAKKAGQENLVRQLTVEGQRYRAGKPLH